MKLIATCSLAVTLLIEGCISTNFSSVTDPAYRGRKLDRILIIGQHPQIDVVKGIEQSFEEAFSLTDVVTYRAVNLMPPIRTYTDEEFFSIIDRYHIDAFLVVSILGEGYQTGTVTYRTRPGTSVTQGTITETSTGYDYSAKTTHTPPRSESIGVSKPRAEFSSVMYHAGDGNAVWRATSQSGGGAFLKISNLISHHAQEVKDQMVKEGFVRSTAKRNLDR